MLIFFNIIKNYIFTVRKKTKQDYKKLLINSVVMLKRLLFIVSVVVFVQGVYAQSGTLKGKVVDGGKKEPIPFANVSIYQNGSLVNGAMTDFDGKYTIKPIPAGSYTVKATYMGYKTMQLNGLKVVAGKITFQNFSMISTVSKLEEVVIKEYKVPLISKDQTETGGTVTSEDIAKMPGRSAASVATTVGGVYSENGEVGSVRGARSEATVYYIDGVKVRGSSSLPKSAIEQVTVVTGGLAAKYGDATGGIISITTKGPTRKAFGSAEYVTSEFLDGYHYNLGEIMYSAPLWVKKTTDPNDTSKVKKEVKAGFFVSASFNHVKDDYPSAIGNWVATDDVLNTIINDPIKPSPEGDVTIYNANYLDKTNFKNVKAKQNISKSQAELAGKIDIKPSKNVNITLGGSMDYRNRHLYYFSRLNKFNRGAENQMFNSANNPQQIYSNWRVYGRLIQKFGSEDQDEEQAKASIIKNVFYRIQVDYSKTNSIVQDDSHKDNLFDYGYVGKFKTLKTRSFSVTDTMGLFPNGVYMQDGFQDLNVSFEPGEVNPVLSKYTDRYYNLYDPFSFHYMNDVLIQNGGGLLNGDQPDPIYGLYNAPGTQYNSYSKSDANQFRISASGSADIKDHEISIGFEFEQRNDNYYGVSPIGLWTLARNNMNFHILELDINDPHYVYRDGVFQDTVYYSRLYNASSQRLFDINMRKHLGLPVDGTDWVDIDSYDPSELSIDYFSADELLNDGNQYVSYYGYDHHGKKLTNKPTLDDFFNAKDENGFYKREIASFQPNYSAAYIQDKFAFNDLVFNVGLRVDRFDANQKVLKDPYVFGQAYTAGDIRNGKTSISANDVNSTMGDDYVVYVNDIKNPTSIKGYRTGFEPSTAKWYNANGTLVDDPQEIAASTGMAPYLVDENAGLTADAFEDYKPQINAMPRISFSFPISDVALFFAHYDILTKRPTTGNRLDPLDYLFIQTRGSQQVNNPNLKPEKTVDYELGFQQKVSNSSSIKLSAFYRRMQDMVQLQMVYGAYPVSYMTYSNIDFGTVKGFTMSYDLRRTGNISLRASYTMQFANGTGSNAETQKSMIQSGQPNLRTTLPLNFDQRHAIVLSTDYRYASGQAYNGPKWFGKDVFENTGVNFVVNFGTGSPYSKKDPVNGSLIGNINGSRKPARTTVNMRIDRNIELAKKGDNKKDKMYLNVYFDISNLLNAKNIISVYSTTGNADDDGYLYLAKNQSLIENQYDEEAYRNYYTMLVNNPNNYSLPRQIKFGVSLNF